MEKKWSDLTPYEVERQRTIEANNRKLEALNIPRLSQSIQKSSSTKRDRMRFVRPGDLQVAANSKHLRSNDIPKPSPRVITPPSSASQDAPPSSPTHDATSHRLTKKGRPKRSQPPHFQFQPQHQHQHQPSPPPSPPQHQPSPTQPQPQHQPSPPPSPPQHQLPTTSPQHQPPPPQHQPSPPQHQLSTTPPQHQPPPPQHQPSPPPSPPQHQLSTTPPQHQPPPPQYQSSEPEHEAVLERLPQPPPPPRNHAHWIVDVIDDDVPLAKKDLIYDNNIKAKFVVSDTNKFHKKWIYTSLGKRLSPDTMAKADKNALNRQKQRIPHTLGTRSLAKTKDIMEQRDGRSYNRGDMYEISHTKRNGSYVNDEARQKNEELQKERQTSSDNEAFVTVFGKERHGYVRGMGLGPTSSQINGSSCRPSGSTFSSTADAKIAKMQSEIDVLTKEVAEVNELKAKVAEFDAMKEQFALIMANMQNHGSNIGSPFEVRRSSESSHNVEGDQATPDDLT
ncbi:hypothetical protein P8452_08257 [Trifolium repens]|nr:hypothetical protein P8452_08257 [Trifolium repens]